MYEEADAWGPGAIGSFFLEGRYKTEVASGICSGRQIIHQKRAPRPSAFWGVCSKKELPRDSGTKVGAQTPLLRTSKMQAQDARNFLIRKRPPRARTPPVGEVSPGDLCFHGLKQRPPDPAP